MGKNCLWEDVRKAPFYGQIAPNGPVSVVFSAASAYQSTGMGVVSVGEGQGTWGQDDPRGRETFSVDLTVCKLQTSQCTH